MLRRLSCLSLLLLAGCGRTDAPRIDGGGATFIEPLMLKWQRVYDAEIGVQVDYTGTGSGNGVQQMIRGAVLFGCTDVPLTAEQRRKARGEVVHIPLALGAVVPVCHLSAIPVGRVVKLSGPVLADMFLGRITRWDDPAVTGLNSELRMPNLPIKVVSRSDPSGTTAVFAEYLAKMRPRLWADENMGAGMAVTFAAGIRQKGNAGVAGEVDRLDGAIGYVELAFARHLQGRVATVAVRNHAGKFVSASPESVAAAAAALAEVPADLCFSIVDPPGPDAYPIGGADWAVFYRRLPADRGKTLVEFLRWATSKNGGQRYAAGLGYAPLPDRLIERCNAVLNSVEFEP